MADGIIFPSGSGVDLEEADATVDDVMIGKTFFSYASDDVQTGTNNAQDIISDELVYKGLPTNSEMSLDTLAGYVTSGLIKGATSASGNFTDTSLIDMTKYKVVNFGVDFGEAPSVSVWYSGGNFNVSAESITRTGFRYKYDANGGIWNGVTFYWSATKV